MGNQPLKLKNFTLPSTSLPIYKDSAYMKIIPKKDFLPENYKQYLCKTFSLKAMKQITI